MKPTPVSLHPALASAVRFLCCAVFPAIAPAYAAAPGAAPGAPPEPKTYSLFMGADFDVQQHDTYYRVVNVAGSAFVVTIQGEPVRIPTEGKKLKLNIRQSVKITTRFANIDGLKSDRAYTPANNPWRKWSSRVGQTNNVDVAASQLIRAQAAVDAFGGLDTSPGGDPAVVKQAQAATAAAASAMNNYTQASMEAGGDMFNNGSITLETQKELDRELFDAVEVTFDVSSATPLHEPYIVIVALYHDPGDPGKAVRSWVYGRALEFIDATPRRVQIFQGGFPPGFTLEKLQLHLYNRGRELATNVADKRIALTYEEASTYLLIDYLGTHRGATLPATPALAKVTNETRSRLGDQFARTYYVQVSKDGRPQEAYLDDSCSQKISDPYLNSVINDIRFNPALEKGQPVAGVARVRLEALPTL